MVTKEKLKVRPLGNGWIVGHPGLSRTLLGISAGFSDEWRKSTCCGICPTGPLIFSGPEGSHTMTQNI